MGVPAVSVLMSLYFREKPAYLEQALESLLQQTSVPDEIVIIAEGELPKELEQVLDKYRQLFPAGTLKVYPAAARGFAQCLNEGLSRCSNDWIVRFDTDDICLPQRIEQQRLHLAAHPDVVVASAPLIECDETMSVTTGVREVPLEHEAIFRSGKWKNPFNHPSAIYRKDVALQLGGYPLVAANEDYAFFSTFLAKGYKAANYPKPLVKARAGAGLINRRRGSKYLKGELECLRYMRSIGYLSPFQYMVHVASKRVIRSLPRFMVKGVYNLLRK